MLVILSCKQEEQKSEKHPESFRIIRHEYKRETLVPVTDVVVSLVATFSNNQQMVLADSVDAGELSAQQDFQLFVRQDSVEILLVATVKAVAHISIDTTGDGVADQILESPYLEQRKGCLISPTCANPVRL